MLGILMQLLLSFLVLRYFTDHFKLSNLLPKKRTLVVGGLGLLWPIVYFSVFEFSVGRLVGNPYRVNELYTFSDLVDTLVFILKSVIFEELLFRGALLYVLLQKLGERYAIAISAVCFGIYHWFAWQVLGNPAQMIVVFLTTGSMGGILAFAFVRTRSMILPTVLHLGTNVINMLVFSKDFSIGRQWLVKSFANDPLVPPDVVSLPIIVIHYVGYQCFTLLVLHWLVRRDIQS